MHAVLEEGAVVLIGYRAWQLPHCLTFNKSPEPHRVRTMSKVVEADQAFTGESDSISQTLFNWHKTAANALEIFITICDVFIVGFAIFVLVYWNITVHNNSSSLADSDYARCLNALPAEHIPLADRFCGSFIPWTEHEAALWVLIPGLLTILLRIIINLDVGTRIYAGREQDSNGNSIWRWYQTNVGISSSVNAIEQHGVDPRGHLGRMFTNISFFALFTMVSTNFNITYVGASVIFAITYSLASMMGATLSHSDQPPTNALVMFAIRAVIVVGNIAIVGWYNFRPFVSLSNHYTEVVFWSGVTFLFVYLFDLLWDPVHLILRGATTKSAKNMQLSAEISNGYFSIDEASKTAAQVNVQPAFALFFVTAWTRLALFKVAFIWFICWIFIYHGVNSVVVLI